MLGFFVRRIMVMIPTLLAISAITFVIIQLPPGDYLTTLMTELESRGEAIDQSRLQFLRETYGFDKPMIEQYFVWLGGMLPGDYGYSFEYNRPVADVVGDRMLLTIVVSFATIIFIWVVSFPIGIYSATHQYSLGDYGLTFLGFLGLATPNFLLALVLLYFANVTFGTSIGGLMDPVYLDAPWSWGKVAVGAGAPLDSGDRHRHQRHRRHDPPAARQPAGRAAQAVCRDGPGQGSASGQGALEISAADGDQPLHLRYRQSAAADRLRGRRGSIVLSLPTTGPMLLDALRSQDMYLAGSFLMFLALLTVVGVLMSDLALAVLDPRIRLEGGANR